MRKWLAPTRRDLNMKHNERARVAPLYLTFTHPFRTKKMQQTDRWLFLLLLFLLLLLLLLESPLREAVLESPLLLFLLGITVYTNQVAFELSFRRFAAARAACGIAHSLTLCFLGVPACVWVSSNVPPEEYKSLIIDPDGQGAWVTKICLAKRLDARREPYLC